MLVSFNGKEGNEGKEEAAGRQVGELEKYEEGRLCFTALHSLSLDLWPHCCIFVHPRQREQVCFPVPAEIEVKEGN